VDDTLEVLLNL